MIGARPGSEGAAPGSVTNLFGVNLQKSSVKRAEREERKSSQMSGDAAQELQGKVVMKRGNDTQRERTEEKEKGAEKRAWPSVMRPG